VLLYPQKSDLSTLFWKKIAGKFCGAARQNRNNEKTPQEGENLPRRMKDFIGENMRWLNF
jgi:hypothetical protein